MLKLILCKLSQRITFSKWWIFNTANGDLVEKPNCMGGTKKGIKHRKISIENLQTDGLFSAINYKTGSNSAKCKGYIDWGLLYLQHTL